MLRNGGNFNKNYSMMYSDIVRSMSSGRHSSGGDRRSCSSSSSESSPVKARPMKIDISLKVIEIRLNGKMELILLD